MRFIFYSIVLTLLCVPIALAEISSTSEEALHKSLPLSPANAHQFSFKSIDGKDMPLIAFKGSVILLVNTASQCGFTDQYTGLQNLYETYKDRGLVVIGVPCNDFGNQEPGDLDVIKDFTKNQFGITFPLTQKYSVKGDDIHPFFSWAARQKKGGFLQSSPKWNFHKFLIDKNGNLVNSFGSHVSPTSSKVRQEIERVLALKSPSE